TGAVQIDIIDSVRFESGTLQRGPHGVCGLAAVRSRRGHVIGVAALTITAYGQPRLPRLGQTYQCETAGLTDIDAAPVTITGSAYFVGQQLQGIETVECSVTQTIDTTDNCGVAPSRLQCPVGTGKGFGTG